MRSSSRLGATTTLCGVENTVGVNLPFEAEKKALLAELGLIDTALARPACGRCETSTKYSLIRGQWHAPLQGQRSPARATA